MTTVRVLVILLSVFAVLGSKAVSSVCDVCGGGFDDGLYSITDEVDKQTKWLCDRCADLETRCYRCGVPVWKDYLTLSDGRVVCQRDQAGIVLDDAEALKVCGDVDRTLASILGRFTTFPSTNVEIRLADRVDVRALVGVAGYDFSCPNLLGYTLSLQKGDGQLHQIRLLTGLQKGVLQATYAHELAHAWISENLSRSRELELKGDAAEGFCELIGYLVAEAYRDETAKSHVLGNQYTRGQILLFIEAERRFGMSDMIEWMQYGTTTRLEEGRLGDVRDVAPPASPPSRPVSEILFIPKTPPKPKETLELTSITIGPSLSIATINGRAFEPGEERKVPLGGSNVVLRCLAINRDSVLVEHVDAGKQERLTLRPAASADSEAAPPPDGAHP